MKNLSIGKLRGLQKTSSSLKTFSICALDHRNNLRRLLFPEKPESAPISEMVKFKLELVGALASSSSAVLLDPEWSGAQCIAANIIPPGTGIVMAIEATGYSGDANDRESRILTNWSVHKAKRMGIDAVKLLVYYHPDHPNHKKIEELINQTAEDCIKEDLAFFLEPLSYSMDLNKKKVEGEERKYVVVETARRLSPLGVDVLKAEFPLDIQNNMDQRAWEEACHELSEASVVPWILLSASVGIETYLQQVAVACNAGASGVAVGRAVWKEATDLKGKERTKFLHGEARSRMNKVSSLVDALAVPWTNFYQSVEINEKWYSEY